MSECVECFYTCVITSDNKCVMTSEGKHVIVGDVVCPSEGGNFEVKRRVREIPRDWYWEMKGWKIVPVFFDYDILFQLLVELSAEMFGVKLKESEKVANLKGEAALLRTILAKVLGEKGNFKVLDEPIIGKKAKDSVIQIGLDGAKLYEALKDFDANGAKGVPAELEALTKSTKVKVSEIFRLLQGLKLKVETSNTPITGAKLNELVKEHFFQGKVDVRALMYLLFEEDGIEGASLIDELTNKELFILLDEDEDESED